MKKLSLLALGLLLSSNVWADIDIAPLQNKIMLQLQAEQWVTTKTALVSVSVNASVTEQGLGNIQATALQKLNQLSNKAEWHIVAFNRQEDKAGLETVIINAQARLPQPELADLRSKAKNISKPGETYTIDDVQFAPSDEEIKAANVSLRNDIYQQAKTEVDTVNKIYPDQKFYIHIVDFNSQIMPMALGMQQREQNTMMFAKAASAPAAAPLAVGNKAYATARVEIAAMPSNIPSIPKI